MSDLEYVENRAIASVKARANRKILLAAPEHKQRNAALGILPDAEADAIRQMISSIRAECDQDEARIAEIIADDALSDEEKVEALFRV